MPFCAHVFVLVLQFRVGRGESKPTEGGQGKGEPKRLAAVSQLSAGPGKRRGDTGWAVCTGRVSSSFILCMVVSHGHVGVCANVCDHMVYLITVCSPDVWVWVLMSWQVVWGGSRRTTSLVRQTTTTRYVEKKKSKVFNFIVFSAVLYFAWAIWRGFMQTAFTKQFNIILSGVLLGTWLYRLS